MKKSLISLVALGLMALPLMAGEMEFMAEFPEAGVYTIKSLPSFNVAVGDRTEVVTCNAELVLRTGNAYVTDTGERRVDLEIVDWHAKGTSELLGDVEFKLVKGAAAPEPSYVQSYQVWNSEKPQDFPAHAQFAVTYELETQYGKVAGLFGLTEGSIRAFPPSGDIFTMKKGDTAELMAALMPEPVSALSAAGEVTPVDVTIRPSVCVCPDIE